MITKFKDNSEIQIGDIFNVCWGYSMTIQDFYKVISKKGAKSAVLAKCEREIVEGDGFQGRCIAGNPTDRTVIGRICKDGYFSINGHLATLWDGRPKMFDHLD